VNGIDKIWAADLVKMQAFSKFNRGVRYLLTVIGCFCSKTNLENLSQTRSRRFSKNQSKTRKALDKGHKFYNKHVKEWGVELYSIENEEKSSVVDR